MPISSIDTHKFVRRLEQAGMPVHWLKSRLRF